MPNKLSRFWKKFKSGKTLRLLGVSLLAAYLILEVLNIRSSFFNWPWPASLAIFFLITIIVAVIGSTLWRMADLNMLKRVLKLEIANATKEIKAQKMKLKLSVTRLKHSVTSLKFNETWL
jgi:ATP/ADP translocase